MNLKLTDITEDEVNNKLKKLIFATDLTFEEADDFFDSLKLLEFNDKVTLVEIVENDPEIIYAISKI